MISVSRSHAPADGYFTKEGPYFEKDVGYWFGGLARALGIEGQEVRKHEFALLRWGIAPDGTPLLQNAGQRRPDGRGTPHPLIQLTANPPGDVKFLIALFPERRAAVLDAHDRAVKALLPHVESMAQVRLGKAGAESMSASICAAVFRHDYERRGTVFPHSHIVVMPAALADGKTRRIAERVFFRAQKALSALYDAALARNLRDLGLRIVPREVGFELEGVPREAVRLLSPRRAEIEAEMERQGVSGARAAERITRLTRRHHPRQDRPVELVFEEAREKLERVGFTRERFLGLWLAEPTQAPTRDSSPRELLRDAVKQLPTDKPFTRHDVERVIAREGLRHGLGITEVLALATKWLFGPDVHAIPARRSTEERFVRREVVAELTERLERLASREGIAASPPAIQRAEREASPSDAAAAVLRAIASDGARVRLVLAEPGPEKDRLLSALTSLHRSSIAFSLTRDRREALQELGFEKAFTVAKAMREWRLTEWNWTPFVNAPHRAPFVSVKTSALQDSLAAGFGLISGEERRFRAWQRSREGLDFSRRSDAQLVLVDSAGCVDPASLARILREAEKNPGATVFLCASSDDAYARFLSSHVTAIELSRLRNQEAERLLRELRQEYNR